MSEQSFEQMLEESFKTIRTGEVVTGKVIDVKEDEIVLNIGYKSDGIITRSEYTNEPIVDPYETKEAEKETTSPYGYTEAVTESKSGNSAVSALGLYPDSKTEQKFTDHAREVYERIKADEKKAEARRSQDYELDMKEKEFADSVGLGGYYEDKIGPGYQGVSGQGQKVYYYTEPSTGTRYELSLLQMKELLGSGKWREQNGGK